MLACVGGLRLLGYACKAFWPPKIAFYGGIWKISMPSTWWCGACNIATGLTSESIFFSSSLSPPQNLRHPWKFHSSPWEGVMMILILIFLIAIFSYLFVWLIFLKKKYHLIFNLLGIRLYDFSSFGASSLMTRVIG